MEIKRKLDSIGISRINISIFLLEGKSPSLRIIGPGKVSNSLKLCLNNF